MLDFDLLVSEQRCDVLQQISAQYGPKQLRGSQVLFDHPTEVCRWYVFEATVLARDHAQMPSHLAMPSRRCNDACIRLELQESTLSGDGGTVQEPAIWSQPAVVSRSCPIAESRGLQRSRRAVASLTLQRCSSVTPKVRCADSFERDVHV